MKKTITFILFIIIIFVVIMINPFKKEKNNKITVSEVTHSVFYAPWYVAIENGYFKENNLDIEVILTPGADKVATSVLSNSTDIGFSGPEATIYIFNNSKQKLITFASLTKKDGQFIVGDCKYKDTFKMSDLEGKKVLAGRSGGMPLMMFEYALLKENVNKDKVGIDTSVEFSALSGAYLSGNGDFVNLFEPNASKIENAKKGCVLASLGNISGVVPYTTFYAKEEYIQKNKENIKKFNDALNKGLKFVKDNNSYEIAKVISKQFPDTSLKELSSLIDRYKKIDSWYDTTYVNIKDYYKLVDIMIYGKSLDKKPTLELLITNEFN